MADLRRKRGYDPDLAGLSAEAGYDRITTDLRRHRKLATLRGHMC